MIINRKKMKGFTMIEMLIVIAIISILTALSLFGLQNSRETARDAARKGDLQMIANALEIYRSDCHEYPAALPAATFSLQADCDSDGIPNPETYIQEMPGDPVSGTVYNYNVGPNQLTYVLCSHLEEPPAVTNTTGCGVCDPANCEYRVVNP